MSTVETLEKGVRLTIKIPERRGWVKILAKEEKLSKYISHRGKIVKSHWLKSSQNNKKSNKFW